MKGSNVSILTGISKLLHLKKINRYSQNAIDKNGVQKNIQVTHKEKETKMIVQVKSCWLLNVRPFKTKLVIWKKKQDFLIKDRRELKHGGKAIL